MTFPPDFDWLSQPARTVDTDARSRAAAHQNQLTKPPGSLGKLEELAIQLAGLQARERPTLTHLQITVFAADHGIAAEGVSAFPQAVTAQMIDNFATGGAAVAVLARQLGARMSIVDLGTVNPAGGGSRVKRLNIAPSTENFAVAPAMTEAQLALALAAGRDAVHEAREHDAELFIGGDMGIANTTSAAALACAYGAGFPLTLAGPGTGLDAAGVRHKAQVLERALALHAPALAAAENRPLETLRRLGGFEIAALAGAYIACAQIGIPALVDGYITSAAALAACKLRPDTANWLIYAHRSAESGHAAILALLHADPLLDLGLRLGEGSGAAVAVPLLRAACALHAQMATFTQAGISNRDEA